MNPLTPLFAPRQVLPARPRPWSVTINSVPVGTLSEADYMQFVRKAYRSPDAYFAQMKNLLSVTMRVTNAFLILVPLAIFWLMVLVAFGAPDLASDWLNAARALPEAEAIVNFRSIVVMASILVAIWALLGLSLGVLGLGRHFGLDNCFQRASMTAIRQHFNIPADGTITLTR